jgi:hypothetical protein
MTHDSRTHPVIPAFDARAENADTSRLLGMVFALSAEVFVLKAQVQEMKVALSTAGGIDAAALSAAGASEEVALWMAEEGNKFSAAVLRPFAHPEETVDATAFMREV